ncbi:MAG TPA: TRAP transporter substrate-binding protein DctP [Syntrophorhabdaceae bacterium]|nr:TRAP transporter substrate-binding protein DctP [Syntrophorhabdaceae bacterium]
MKKTSMLNVLAICLVVFALIAVGSVKVFAQEKQIIIRYVTQLPTTHLLTQADYRMAKMIEERTKGRVKVEVYPGGQLYKGMELLKGIMTGAVEMGIMYNAIFTGPIPLFDIFDIPFLFNNYNEVTALWRSEVGDKIRSQMEKIGIKGIAYSAYGESFSMCSHKPLIKVSDFKGMKIRCNTNMGADTIKEFGASPVLFAAGEVYEALQRKTIDAASSGPTTIKERKWYELTQNVTVAWASYSVWPVMVNLKFWNSLPKDIQQVLLDVGKDHEAYVLQKTTETDLETVKFLKGKVKVYELTPADRKAWAAYTKPVIDKLLKRTGSDGQQAIEWIRKNLKRN